MKTILTCMTAILVLGLPSIGSITGAAYPVKTSGITWYVSLTGNDANDCLSPATACATIGMAVSQATSGDTILVAAGIYNRASGEAFPITVPPGVSLIGSGRDITILAGNHSAAVVELDGSASDIDTNTIISGLTLQQGTSGLRIYATAQHLVTPLVANLRLTQNGTGISMATSAVYEDGATIGGTISNTEVVSNTQNGILLQSYGYFSPALINPLIVDSFIQGNGDNGVYAQGMAVSTNGTTVAPHFVRTQINSNHNQGLYLEGSYMGWVRPVVEQSRIENNLGYGVYWTMGGNGGKVDAVFTNTVIAHNQSGGVYLDTEYSFDGVTYFRMINCDIVNNGHYGFNWQRGEGDYNFGVSPFIFNSVLWNPGADDLYSSSANWSTLQLQYSDIKDGDLQGQTGNFSADPLLSESDHLSSCSPLMNTGNGAGAPAIDIDDEVRPQGSAVDVGADEFESPCWVSVYKSASATQGLVGDPLAYTITLTNTTIGTLITGTLTDALDQALSYLPASGWASSGTLSNTTSVTTPNQDIITWTGMIAPGAVLTIGLQARMNMSNTVVTNQATFDAGAQGIYLTPRVHTEIIPHRIYFPLMAKPDPAAVVAEFPFTDRCTQFSVVYNGQAAHLTMCVTSVQLRVDGQMKFNLRWSVEFLNNAIAWVCKGSDVGNRNMNATDTLGNRYDHVQLGGAAAQQTCFYRGSGITSADGWYLFPPAQPGATTFTFHDDDQHVAIGNIVLVH